MDEEEQFVNIDLNDDNICSVCKLETEAGTLSFCHVCFELSIEGVSSTTLLHSKSLRGHRDCFEKCHLIANQKLSRSKVSRSAYEGMKLALSQKLNRIIHRRGAKLFCYSQQGDRKLLPQTDAQVPRYAPQWDTRKSTGLPEYTMGMLDTVEEFGLLQHTESDVWNGNSRKGLHNKNALTQHGHNGHSREELAKMSVEELHQLNGQLLIQIQTDEGCQEKDSLASELHVRHIAIEQLFKNCAKLPWLQISRAGVKASSGGPGE
uniref:Chromosome 21 open reading frame 91 n=1 Tax=Neogobius melanostomus TaxID=47308 RepID=A0A8C6TWU7_9GOBI